MIVIGAENVDIAVSHTVQIIHGAFSGLIWIVKFCLCIHEIAVIFVGGPIVRDFVTSLSEDILYRIDIFGVTNLAGNKDFHNYIIHVKIISVNHNEIIAKLREIGKDSHEYRKFNARIINDTTVEYLGVRVPEQRKIAKEIANGDWRKFIAENNWNIYEMKAIAFQLPEYLNQLNIDEFFALYDELIPHASSWANTDSLGVKSKIIAANPEKAWTKITQYLASRNGWEVRIGLNLAFANFLNDEYIDRVIAEIQKVDKRYRTKTQRGTVEYYVKMMLAWILAEAAINYRDKVEAVLSKIDNETAKMAQQKMRDSRRVKT